MSAGKVRISVYADKDGKTVLQSSHPLPGTSDSLSLHTVGSSVTAIVKAAAPLDTVVAEIQCPKHGWSPINGFIVGCALCYEEYGDNDS